MMKYYYSDNGELRGPFSKAELSGKPITAETLVWIEGMETWRPARDVPMFADILDGSYVPEMPATQFNLHKKTDTHVADRQCHGATSAFRQQSPYSPQPVPPPAYGTQSQPGGYPPPRPAVEAQPPVPPVYGSYRDTCDKRPPQPPVPPCHSHQTQPMTPPPFGGKDVDTPSQHFGWTVTGTVLNGLAVLGSLTGATTSICFIIPLILGIVGITKSNSVGAFLQRGDMEGARRASESARSLGMWSVCIYIAMMVIGIFLLILVGVAVLGLASGSLS